MQRAGDKKSSYSYNYQEESGDQKVASSEDQQSRILNSFEEGACRTETILRLNIKDVHNFDGILYSNESNARNLPWRFLVQSSIKPNKVPEQRYFGIFLHCNNKDGPKTWACYVNAELRLLKAPLNYPSRGLSSMREAAPFVKKIHHLFTPKKNYCGYSFFISLEEVLQPQNGYIQNGSITFEAYVFADAPWDQSLNKISEEKCVNLMNEQVEGEAKRVEGRILMAGERTNLDQSGGKEIRSMEKKAVEDRPAKKTSGERKFSESKLTEKNSFEKKPIERKYVERKSVDRKFEDRKSVDRKSVDRKSVDSKSVDRKPTERNSARKKPEELEANTSAQNKNKSNTSDRSKIKSENSGYKLKSSESSNGATRKISHRSVTNTNSFERSYEVTTSKPLENICKTSKYSANKYPAAEELFQYPKMSLHGRLENVSRLGALTIAGGIYNDPRSNQKQLFVESNEEKRREGIKHGDNGFDDKRYENKKKSYEDKSYERNRYEDNIYEDNRYEDNRYESNRYDGNRYEDNRCEDNRYEDKRYENYRNEDNRYEDRKHETNKKAKLMMLKSKHTMLQDQLEELRARLSHVENATKESTQARINTLEERVASLEEELEREERKRVYMESNNAKLEKRLKELQLQLEYEQNKNDLSSKLWIERKANLEEKITKLEAELLDERHSRSHFGISRTQFGGSGAIFGNNLTQFVTSKTQMAGSKTQVEGNKNQVGSNKTQLGTGTNQIGASNIQIGAIKTQVESSKIQFRPSKNQFGPSKTQFGTSNTQFGINKNHFEIFQELDESPLHVMAQRIKSTLRG